MTAAPGAGPRWLVVGGCGGLVGRAVLAELGKDRTIRSVHRRPIPSEQAAGVEFVASDAATETNWAPLLREVDTVLTLAWYRDPRNRRFAPLSAGIRRLIDACEAAGIRRYVQLSVPDAPPALETRLPYLTLRREVDRHLASSRLDYVIVRPTMLFAPGDRLATVMMRTIRRYGRLPMFGDGEYHLSPLATGDLARVLRVEGERGGRRTVSVGGPERWTYRALAERMFRAFGRPTKYLALSPANSRRLAAVLERLGSTLIYEYEVEWLLSDMLGLPPYDGLDRPMATIGPFLDRVAGSEAGSGPGAGVR